MLLLVLEIRTGKPRTSENIKPVKRKKRTRRFVVFKKRGYKRRKSKKAEEKKERERTREL